MKLLIAVSCLLAVASAGFVGLGHTAYTYPYVAHAAQYQHLPVIGANGVPVDEPAVQVARAEHAAAHVDAKLRNGDAAVFAHSGVVAPFGVVAHSVYAGPQHLPVIGANGVPVDEPAVQALRVQHAAHHVEAKVRNGDAAVVAPFVAHVAGPVVPAETPEVVAARAAHFAAHVEAKARNGVFHHLPLVHYRKRRGVFGAYAAPYVYSAAPAVVAHSVYSGPQHLPVIGANGVPVDEPAVQQARAEHAAAHVEASGRAALSDAVVVGEHSAVVAAGPFVAYSGPQHLPVIGANGVPVDEPAVQAARVEHAAAHVEAKVRNGDAAVVAAAPVVSYAGHHYAGHHYAGHHVAAPVVAYAGHYGHYAYGAQHVPVIGANGVPIEEPAVASARAAHYAAHVEAKVRNGDLHHFVGPVVHY